MTKLYISSKVVGADAGYPTPWQHLYLAPLKQWHKKIGVFVVFLMLAIFLFGCAGKVTDPNLAGFDINQFRFEDYKNEKELSAALTKMFPVGTDKDYIRLVLIEKAMAKIANPSIYSLPDGIVRYFYEIRRCKFILLGNFNKENKLERIIEVNHGCDAQ